ncbi:MAG: polysaccharide pyruvyl transferase family protein [Desulfobacula sp.]|nr:polysaccharide pyruvyl transferase family protein [Desulfobacula sp.]
MAKDNIKFLFVGSPAYSNRGCEAIVRGTIEVLSERFPNAQYIISNELENKIDDENEVDSRIERRLPLVTGWVSFRKLLKISWWKYRILLRPFRNFTNLYIHSTQIKALNECICALEVGGDNYTTDYGHPEWLFHLDDALLSTGKPLVLWGASIGPFTKAPEVEKMMVEHLKRFHLILARETETLSYLKSLGIEKNVKLVADPAFVMVPIKPVLPNELNEFLEKKPLGLNLSRYVGKFRESKSNGNWEKIARETIRALLDSDLGPILLVPHVFKEDNDDHKFLMEVTKDFSEWGKTLAIIPKDLRATEIKWVISKLRIFAGARTHSTIAGLSSLVPTLTIGYSAKGRGINQDIFGNHDWLLPIDKFGPETLLEKFHDLYSNEEKLRETLSDRIPYIQKQSFMAGKYVDDLLNAL